MFHFKRASLFWLSCWSVAAVAIAALFWAGTRLGNLNQDEGWYLISALRVNQGAWPFRDFAFTQGPVFPFIYGLFFGIVRRWGVLGGRLLTGAFGLLSLGLAALLAARCSPRGWKRFAALCGLVLGGVNLYQAYFFCVVKTYSLAALLLLGALLALSFATHGRRRTAWAFLAGMLMAAATATRLSAGAALAVTGLYLLLSNPRDYTRGIAFGLGGAAGLALLTGPFLLTAPHAVRFGLLAYHAQRTPGSPSELLLFKAGFLLRTLQAYAGLAITFLIWAVARISLRPANHLPSETPAHAFGPGLPASIVATITLVHFATPFPYDDYQAFIMPLAAAALAAATAGLLARHAADENRPSARAVCASLLATMLLLAAASPLPQEWTILRRDRIWWIMKNEPDLVLLQRWGAWLRARTPAGGTLLTQDAYLAIEAGLDVPRGLEMGPFSYYPDATDEEAARMGGVLNREGMKRLLAAADSPYAAFSGYGLAIRNPSVTPLAVEEQDELWSIVHANYDISEEVPDFGQGNSILRIFCERMLEESARQR